MTTRRPDAVEARGLVKSFGRTRAIDGVDITVPPGTVFGLLGPNGAGKTTTVRVLTTLVAPDAGAAQILGHDVRREPDQVRRRISVTGQFASIDEDLSGLENLRLQARLLGMSRRAASQRAYELLEAFDLVAAAGRQVKNYSGGMKRRVDVAASVVVTPELLFLDEPTTGLDPRSRHQVWEIVRGLTECGTTVLLTTQYLDEADRLADRIAVIDHGRIVADDTPSRLKASVGSGSLRIRLAVPAERGDAGKILSVVTGTPVQSGSDPTILTASFPAGAGQDATELVTRALAALDDNDIDVAGFALDQPSLDEVFLALTGHTAVETTEEEIA